MAVRRTVTLSRYWKAWAGSVSDLRRLAEATEKHFQARKEALLLAFDKETAANLEELKGTVVENSLQFEQNWMQKSRTTRRKEMEDRYSFRVRLIDSAGVADGSVDEIFHELDHRSFSSVALKAHFGWGIEDELSISLEKSGHTPGVALSIKSTDQAWSRQAFSHLSDEIAKGVPGWVRMRSERLRATAAFLMCLAVAVPLGLLYSEHDVWESNWASFLAALGAGLWPVVIVYTRLWDYIFPPLDLHGEGGVSTGSRRLAFVFSIFLAIALGVLVNLIS